MGKRNSYHIWEDVVPKVQVEPMNLTKEIANNLQNSIIGGHLWIKKTLSKERDNYSGSFMVDTGILLSNME